MTVIATDGKSVAADGMSCTSGGEIVSMNEVKIKRVGNAIYGLAGASCLDAIIDWVLAGALKDGAPICDDWSLLKVERGRAQVMHQSRPIWSTLMLPAAMGSGELIAIGAMCAGATPFKAVGIACERLTTCGGMLLSIEVPYSAADKAEAAE